MSHWALTSFITVVDILGVLMILKLFHDLLSIPVAEALLEKIFCSLVYTKVKWLQLVCCTCRNSNNQDPVVFKMFLDQSIHLAFECIRDQESWLIRTVHLLSNSCDIWLEDTHGAMYACFSMCPSSLGFERHQTYKGR